MLISRAELYRLVSETPLSKAAPALGVSPTVLASICRRYQIPYPGSGYWTKKSLGLPHELSPLPPLADKQDTPIEIEAPKPNRPNQQHRAATPSSIAAQGPALPEINAPKTETPTPLTKPHPIIAKWLAERERRRREAASSRDDWMRRSAPAPLTEIDHRRHRILDALFRALEARGAKISEGEKGLLRVTISGEHIDFQLREKNRQVRQPAGRDNSYPRQDLIGTGKLVFAIRTYLRGPHNEEWLETDKNPIEAQLPAIIDRLFEGAEILKAWHAELAQAEELRRKAAQRRAEEERLLKEQGERRQLLVTFAQKWQEAHLVRQFLNELRSMPTEVEAMVGGRSIADWLVWAEECVQVIDPTSTGVTGIFAKIANVKVEKSWRHDL